MNGKLTILVCILVAGVIVGASLPIFDSLTASSDSIHNEGAGWVRFDLNKSADASYNINVSWDDDGYYIANGSNVQTFDDSTTEDFNTIIYADSNVSVWTYDGDNILMLGAVEGSPVMATFTDPVSIARDSAGVVVSDGTDSYTFGAPAWAYVPQSSGAYGFFNYDEERGVKNPTGTPTAVIGGGNVGVYAYNDIYTYDGLGLTMHPIIDAETGLYYGAEWYRDIAPFDPDGITINPLDPSVINPGDSTQPVTPIDDPGIDIIDPFNPGAVIMAVPTPTYNSGDWGYDLTTVNGVQKAVIVSYSGSGGDIVVPATIGGYDVYKFGKGDPYNVFDKDTATCTSLTISDGIEVIAVSACYMCTGLTGPLVIPNSVKEIQNQAFMRCSFTGSLTLPTNLTLLGAYAFYGNGFTGTLELPTTIDTIQSAVFLNCTGFDKLIIPDNITIIKSSAFSGCSGLKGDLIIPDSVTSIEQSAFNGCGFNGKLVLNKNLTVINKETFKNCYYFTGSVIIPTNITSIGEGAFYSFGNEDALVVPNTVTSIGKNAFYKNYYTNIIIASDATPGSNAFNENSLRAPNVLDLSDTVDYSVNRYGLSSRAVIDTSIGDCFGYIAVADLEGGGNGTIGDLIALLPVIMLAGIVLFSIVALAINRS